MKITTSKINKVPIFQPSYILNKEEYLRYREKIEKIELSCERCNLIIYHWQNWMDLRCLRLVNLTEEQKTILKIEGLYEEVTMKEVYEGDIVKCPYCKSVLTVTEFPKKNDM